MTDPLVAALLAFLVATAALVVAARGPLATVVAFGAYSLGLATLWAVFRAPDVGLTEAAVGAGVTTALFVVVAARTGATRDADAGTSRQVRARSVVAVAALVGTLLWVVPALPRVGDPTAPGFAGVSAAYLAGAPDLGVPNVVTAVLVVYRGFDTFGEVVVVFAAGVAVLAVLDAAGRVVRAGADGEAPAGREMPRVDPPDSPVVTRTVRLVVPFVVTFGLFTTFHGTSSVGGGFQGGVVVAAGLIAVAFSFGAGQTGRWLRGPGLLALAAAGVVGFAAVAVAALAAGGAFLELGALPLSKPVVYGVEGIEVGIGATVAATVVSLFFSLAGVSEP